MAPLPFSARPALIGVVHLRALPGSPGFDGEYLESARRDSSALIEGGCHGVIVENFGDVPFFAGQVPAETVAAMALALREVQAIAGDVPVGVNVLRNDARSALGLCAATGAEFLRVNVHIGAAVTDQGVIEGRAAETLRERARLGLDTALLADVHVKHATQMGNTDIADSAAEAFGRGLADAVLITGGATGSPPTAEMVGAAAQHGPVFVASGLDLSNGAELLEHASGAIVGTALKEGGRLEAAVDVERVRAMRALMDAQAI